MLFRSRHQYKGEVRAFGNIIRDQYLFLDRLGVDAIEVQDTRQLDEWKTAMGEYSVFYQPAADARRPAMALRRQIAEALKPSRPDFDDLTPIGPPRAVRVEVDIEMPPRPGAEPVTKTYSRIVVIPVGNVPSIQTRVEGGS